MTKIIGSQNVLEAALDRVRMLFDRFGDPVVSFSGGKDSTVCLNLAAMVAKERGRPFVRVAFLDQEAEWASVVDYMRATAARPDVRLHWFQVPFRISNNASSQADPWAWAWREGDEWIRPKEPGSIHQNDLGVDRFHAMFPAILARIVGGTDRPACYIAGMRAEESPVRMMTLTSTDKFEGLTWAKRLAPKREQFTFYPIYDWTYRDVWKAIHDHGWSYASVYDLMYQYGVPVRRMRVSNLHHETALDSLRYLQELEPATWNALVKRLPGIATAGSLASKFFPTTLPPMFPDWRSFRDHLLENLIQPDKKPLFRARFEKLDRKYRDRGMQRFDAVVCRLECQSIAANDFEFTKITGWEFTKEVDAFRRWKRGLRGERMMHNNPLIPKEGATA